MESGKRQYKKQTCSVYVTGPVQYQPQDASRVGKWKKNIELDLVRLEIVFAVSRSRFVVVASLQVLGSGCWVLVSGRHRNVFRP